MMFRALAPTLNGRMATGGECCRRDPQDRGDDPEIA
jgi:hypothetical protein